MNKKIKLLNCPFCGGQAELALYGQDKKSNGVAVRCTHCGAETMRVIYQYGTGGFMEGLKRLDNSRTKAAELWNKRCN